MVREENPVVAGFGLPQRDRRKPATTKEIAPTAHLPDMRRDAE